MCVTSLNVVLATWLFNTKMRSVCLANQKLFNRTKTAIVTQKKTEMFLTTFLLTVVKMIYHTLTSFIQYRKNYYGFFKFILFLQRKMIFSIFFSKKNEVRMIVMVENNQHTVSRYDELSRVYNDSL